MVVQESSPDPPRFFQPRLPSYPAERPGLKEHLLLVVAILPLFINLGLLPLTGSEGRWLFIARDMLATGNLVEPRIEGEFYGDKPLLSYWAILLAGLPGGEIDEGISRIPSAVAGAVTGLLTLWLGALLLGRRAALLAGWVLLTSYSFYVWSRTASADNINVAFSTAAILVYVEASRRFAGWKVVLFFALLAAGAHAKGMPAILVPVGVACADAVLARRTDYLRRLPWIIAGLVVGTAFYFLPFYLSYRYRGDWQLLDLMVRENFVRAFDPFDHVEPPWYYLYILPAMFLPWSLWLPGAIGWALRRIRQDAGLRFTLLAFLVIFLEFTASRSRRSYYILPAFPACALLVGGFISGALDALRGDAPLGRPWKILATYPLFLVALVLPAAAIFFLVAPLLPGAPGELGRAFPLALPLGIALALVALLFFASWKRSELRGLFAAAALMALVYTTYASLGGDRIREATMPERPFAAQIASQFPDREIISYRPELRVRLYFPSSTPARGLEELRKILDGRTSEVLVLARPDDAKKLEAAFPSKWREVLRWSAPPFGPIRMDKPKLLLLAYQP